MATTFSSTSIEHIIIAEALLDWACLETFLESQSALLCCDSWSLSSCIEMAKSKVSSPELRGLIKYLKRLSDFIKDSGRVLNLKSLQSVALPKVSSLASEKDWGWVWALLGWPPPRDGAQGKMTWRQSRWSPISSDGRTLERVKWLSARAWNTTICSLGLNNILSGIVL